MHERRERRHTQHDGDSNRQTSPNMESAIQALESLSEVRHYPRSQYSSTTATDGRRPAGVQHSAPQLHKPPSAIPVVPPNAQQGPGPSSMASASYRAVLSMPPSSNNSDDGMADGVRSFEQSSLGHEASEGIHIDRNTRDRLLAVYWTHIHVSLQFRISQSHGQLNLLSATNTRTSGRYFTNQNSTRRLYIDLCYWLCSPPHQRFRHLASRS